MESVQTDVKVTVATTVVLPVIDVPLHHLKDTTGAAVVVRCESIDEIVLWEATGTLPGLVGEKTEEDETAPPEDERVATLKRLKRVAPALLEAGTSLAMPDGSFVRPAIYFGEVAPHPHAIPGRLLRLEDLSDLVEAILRVGGYLGGAADATSFPVRDGGGRSDGEGTVGAGDGDGTDSSGGAV